SRASRARVFLRLRVFFCAANETLEITESFTVAGTRCWSTMQDRILTFFFLTACLVDIATQGPCDVITPCTFSNPDLNE
ncbi:hypothetical protein GBAR_LOCUS4539, partial [Geodia barretti]